MESNTIERKGCSCRLNSVTEVAMAGKSCEVRLVQVRLEEVRLGECGAIWNKEARGIR